MKNKYAQCGMMAFALLSVSACKNSGTKTHPPQSEAWAQALDQRLAAKGQDPAALRDRALLAAAFLPKAPKAERFDALRKTGAHDPLAAYAMAVRASRDQDLDALLASARALLALENTADHSRAPALIMYPATAQVLGWTWALLQDSPDRLQEVDALWSRFEKAPLSPLSRRALLSLVGRSRRLRHQPFASAYQAQGCVQDWSAGPVRGSLGELSLLRADLDAKVADPGKEPAPVFGLACATRVWNPTQESGYVQLRRDLVLKQSGMLLSLSTPTAMRVRLDGQEIWRNDQRDALQSRDAELYIDAAAGRHQLEISVAVPGDKEWVVVRATDLDGRALAQVQSEQTLRAATPFESVRRDEGAKAGCNTQLLPKDVADPLLAQPWIEHCILSHALDQRDQESVHTTQVPLNAFEHFAEGAALLADADLQNPELTDNAGRSAAHQRLTQAVELDPSLLGLRLALARSRNARGEETQVREALKTMPAPTRVADALFRFGIYLEVGDELQADQMLALAQTLDPHHCEVVAASFRRARDLDARARQAEILPKLAHCPGSRTLALRFWSNRGAHDKARAILDDLLKERGDDIDLLFRRAETARAQGDWAQAQQDLQAVLRLQTASMRANLGLADKARSEGRVQEAKARFSELAKRFPSENHLRRYLEELGDEDPLLQGRVDGLSLIEADRKNPAFAQDSAVYLLDRDYVHAYESGAQRHLIHQVVRVQNKEGIDAYGEIRVPQGAELLQLRTIKKDGRIIEPERTSGKSSYSMRALEPGDYVEQEWIMPAQWAQASEGSADLGSFRFASTRAPFVRSELVVRAPKSLKLQVELRNGAPQPTIEDDKDAQVWTFLAQNKPRIVPEPATPNQADLIPQVHCFANLTAKQWLDELLATTLGARRRGPSLRAALDQWIEGQSGDKAKVDAIYQKVHELIEPQGNLSGNANRTLSAGKGNRSNLLYAMLTEAKIPARILVARSAFSPKLQTPKGHPQFTSYDTPILEIWPEDPKKRRYLLAELPFAPLGYLPSWFDGALAYPLPLDGSPSVDAPIELSKGLAKHEDRRLFDVELTLDRQGNAKVRASLKIYGVVAAQWRQALKTSDPERYDEIFSQFELPRFFVGKSPKLESLEIKHQRNRQKPLVMNFELSVPGLAKVQGNTMSLSSFFMHLNPGTGFATLDQRKLDLAVSMSGRQEAHIVAKLPKGMTWIDAPQKALTRKVQGPFGTYTQNARLKGASLDLEIQTQLRPQVISPARYPEFVQFVRAVSQAQVHRLQARG